MINALECFNISKTYPNGVQALSEIALSVKRGELLTLIGPNGAGKTTFVRIVTTQLLPTGGTAQVFGYDVVKEPEKVRQHIALVPQDATTYMSMTPWDYVYYLTKLEGISSDDARDRARVALEQVGLFDLRRRPCYSLSGGERRRAIVAAALASKAEALFLDEPTTGLDPIARRQVWRSLRRMVENGKTILLTTHLMEEAEIVSDRIAIIHKGRLILAGAVADVKASIPAKARVVIRGNHSENFSQFGEVVSFGDREIVYVNDASKAVEIVRLALERGMKAEASSITLEDVFVKLIGGSIE